MRGTDIAIEVKGLSKSFRIPEHRKDTLKERALRPLARPHHRELHALRDVSFEVEQGEFFGVVGRNGSGKSTLLKLLASIYSADAGSIRVAGDIAPFIELAVGFNLEFTAYENALLNGVMMGLTRKEAEQRYDAVMDFAELGDFGDLKLKNYSSGMLTRLAFSLMIQVDADVMLIDEVLAVGDASFQRKCGEVFEELRGKRTIVFVTHDMTAVERYCHRAMMIEDGRIAEIGEPSRVARSYVNLHARPIAASDGAGGFAAVWIEDAAGERPFTLRHGEEISFNAIVEAPQAIDKPRFSFALRNARGDWVFTLPYRSAAPGDADRLEAGQRVHLRAGIVNPLAGGQWSVQCTLIAADREDDLIAVADDAVTIVVDGPGPDGVLVATDGEVSSTAASAEEVRA